MKYMKRYLFFTVLLAIIFTLQFHILDMDTNQVGEFRGAVMAQEVWNPIIAGNVNENEIRLVIDNKEFPGSKYQFFMNDKRDIMVPIEILTEALKCSAHVYQENHLVVEKYVNKLVLSLDNPAAMMDGGSLTMKSPFTKIGGKYYVGINDLAQILGYQVSFDIGTYTLSASNTVESSTIFPTRYDLRESERVSDIKNQGGYGTCWAFAAVSAMESSLLPEEKNLFSVDHMTMCNSFHANQYDGGEYTMGMAYLAAWQGPVFEADDPYGDDVTNPELTVQKHVQEMQIIESKDFKRIKEAVFLYGGVQTSLYSTMTNRNTSNQYYNNETFAYCYIGTSKPNHDVLIVGWDDNYPKENFNLTLEGDGAFICQNSWGDKFGDNGFFYVSYYDTNIGTHNVAYTRIEETDNYSNIYQSDLCGWVGKIGYDAEDMYGANVYTAKENEVLSAAGFYATGVDTEYEIYVVKNFVNTNSFNNKVLVASGTVEQAGYYTIDFDQSINLMADERFAVVLYVKTPGSTHPMAIEYDTGDYYMQNVDLSDGESYISYSGLKFTNVKEKQDCNLCIKAFTKKR